MKKYLLLVIILFSILQSACNVGRFIEPGQKVLRRNVVDISMADSSSVPSEVSKAMSGASQYYYQNPNKKILFVPVKRILYCLSNPNDTNWLNKFLRKTGEAPVVYDKGAAQRTSTQLTTLMKTKGCFGSTVTADTVHQGDAFVDVHYKVVSNGRRKIDELRFGCRQPEIDSLLQQWKGESLLHVGDFYDQDVMTAEQSRLVTNLRNEGYYYASNEVIHFLVDTNYDSHFLSILVVVRVPQAAGDTVRPLLNKYRIDNIYIYPNITTNLNSHSNAFDTLVYPFQTRRGTTNYNFIYDKTITPSPKAISRSMFLFNGSTYRTRSVNNTSNALLGLHNFKYVDISFDESPNSSDTNHLLDARLRLLNTTRQRLSLSFELTNASNFNSKKDGGNFITSGNLGLGTTLGYQNNNFFGNAELLNIEGNLLFDFPKNVFTSSDHSFRNTFSNFENGIDVSLDIPNFLLPFSNKISWQRTRPHTIIDVSTSYLFRNLTLPSTASTEKEDVTLERIRFASSFGYSWSYRKTTQHKLLPFNLSYSHLISGEDYYYYLAELTNDIQFFYQAIDYVLLNTHYEYTYSNQTLGARNNFNYFHLSVETAGNLLNGINKLLSGTKLASTNEDVEFYQYLRLESEFKRYIYWGNKNTLVLRALGGFGIPYGHSVSIPYEKMFVGGGPTTMRGWALRHLGYGQFPSSQVDFAMGTGEIQLVGNIEQRFPIIGIFEGAAFVDAGNVWEYSDWGIGEDAKFEPKEIVKGIALDAGLALRANISVITLRLDLALPLYDPGYDEGERWIKDHWSWNKIVLNFGINYPF